MFIIKNFKKLVYELAHPKPIVKDNTRIYLSNLLTSVTNMMLPYQTNPQSTYLFRKTHIINSWIKKLCPHTQNTSQRLHLEQSYVRSIILTNLNQI